MAKTSNVDEIEHHPQFCLDLSDPLGNASSRQTEQKLKETE
jgi:hypothetical protein